MLSGCGLLRSQTDAGSDTGRGRLGSRGVASVPLRMPCFELRCTWQLRAGSARDAAGRPPPHVRQASRTPRAIKASVGLQ
eukprot:1307892-Rhodomonas_salina.1